MKVAANTNHGRLVTTTALQLIVPANPKRLALIFSVDGTAFSTTVSLATEDGIAGVYTFPISPGVPLILPSQGLWLGDWYAKYIAPLTGNAPRINYLEFYED